MNKASIVRGKCEVAFVLCIVVWPSGLLVIRAFKHCATKPRLVVAVGSSCSRRRALIHHEQGSAECTEHARHVQMFRQANGFVLNISSSSKGKQPILKGEGESFWVSSCVWMG